MNFESSSIFSWYPVDSLPGKSLKSIVELAKKGKLGENGTNRLPSILCGDYTTPLEERNLQNYTLICDALLVLRNICTSYSRMSQDLIYKNQKQL